MLAEKDSSHPCFVASTVSCDMHINLFQRFALVRYWRLTKCLPFSAFLSKDELHMNDWSYGLEHPGSDRRGADNGYGPRREQIGKAIPCACGRRIAVELVESRCTGYSCSRVVLDL